MFTENYFRSNHNFFSESPDLWMRAFLRLHVPSDYKSDKQFKLGAIAPLRKSNVYKTTKLDAGQVERNLLECQTLSVAAFCALAALYRINVAVVLGQLYVLTAPEPPTHYVDAAGRVQAVPSSAFFDMFRVAHVGKPLNALSYYTSADLEGFAAKVRTPKGTKPHMYNGIQAYVQEKLTALPTPKIRT